MKLPLSPPPLEILMAHPETATFELLLRTPQPALVDGKYLHWDELRHRPPPEGANHEQWWLALKMARMTNNQILPLMDKTGRHFTFSMPEPVVRSLHFIDRDTSGQILMDDPVATPQERDRYLVSSLIEEAITSSQLEGASTTRRVAEDMLRAGRKPRTISEQMIFNNYQAMQHIRTVRDEPLSLDLLLDLHRRVSDRTLDNPDEVGKLRQSDDMDVVDQRDGQLLHIPPSYKDLPDRLEKLCAFANGSEDDVPYIHPVIRAILLHFMIGYEHPFADGNGRTARALFYWAMIRQGYWLMEYLSISNILRHAPAQYARAYLHTETDANDTTYFVLHQLDVIHKAVDELHAHLKRKAKEARATERLLGAAMQHLRAQLNHRQIALLGHVLKHRDASYTIESHRHSHAVAYATARADLLQLADIGLLKEQRHGKALVFIVPDDLDRQIEHLSK